MPPKRTCTDVGAKAVTPGPTQRRVDHIFTNMLFSRQVAMIWHKLAPNQLCSMVPHRARCNTMTSLLRLR